MEKELNYVVIGLPSSGKTTLLTMSGHYNMEALLGWPRVSCNVYPDSAAAQQYLASNRDAMVSRGEFPPATDALRELRFRIDLSGEVQRTLRVAVPDVPGELCGGELTTDSESGRNLLKTLAHCDGIVMLVDPAGLGRKAFDRMKSLQNNLERIYLALKDSRQLVSGRLPIPLTVVLTKAERYWDDPVHRRFVRRLVWRSDEPKPSTEVGSCFEYDVELEEAEAKASSRDSAAIQRILQSYEPVGRELVAIVARYFARVTYRAGSAIGMKRDGQNRWRPNLRLRPVVNGAQGRVEAVVADPTHVTPVGILEPIVYLALGDPPVEPEANPLPAPETALVRAPSGWDLLVQKLTVLSVATAGSVTVGAFVWLLLWFMRGHRA